MMKILSSAYYQQSACNKIAV